MKLRMKSRMRLVIDLETRSRRDIKTAGAYEYANDPSTEVLWIAYRWENDIGQVFENKVPDFHSLPFAAVDYLQESTGLVAAFNAQFERLIWEALAPDDLQIAPSRWYCVAALCRVYALPSSLSDACLALGLPSDKQKDKRGNQLIKALCVPQKDGSFLNDKVLMQELGEYCEQDVVATQAIIESLPSLTAAEHNDWLVNERINDTGICIDRDLARTCVDKADAVTVSIGKRLSELTVGVVTRATQAVRLKHWVMERLPADVIERHMLRPKGKYSLDSEAREGLLTDELPVIVRAVVDTMNIASKSSVAKFKRMLDRSAEDGVARGSFVYAGAPQTIRYASRGLQLHNMTKKCFSPLATENIKLVMARDKNYPMTMESLSMLLRPALIPSEGNTFVVGDWASVEARVLPWLAESSYKSAKERLAVFKRNGDIYQITADKMFGGDRVMGKVAELALGFGGAVGAFENMARIFDLTMDQNEMQNAVNAWRAANPWAKEFWDNLENAAKDAVRNPYTHYNAGRVSYIYYPELIGGTLVCKLPDGTAIKYPHCKFETDDFDRIGLTAMKSSAKPAAGQKEWPRMRLWGGLLAENVTQATAAALLRDLNRRLDESSANVVGHVHDEVIVECAASHSESRRIFVQDEMERNPSWAYGLPLHAGVTIMNRYGK